MLCPYDSHPCMFLSGDRDILGGGTIGY
jgi:hypothetical protein